MADLNGAERPSIANAYGARLSIEQRDVGKAYRRIVRGRQML